MRVAVDTSILLDVLGADPTFGPGSREALRRAYDSGSLVISDVAWAEVRASYETEEPFLDAMEGLGAQFLPATAAAATLAGTYWRQYHLQRARRAGTSSATPQEKRVIADFLVGAHARLQADALLARDRGFFRSYFKGLKLIEP